MSYRFPLSLLLLQHSIHSRSTSEAQSSPLGYPCTRSPCFGHYPPLCLHQQLRSAKQVERHLPAYRIPNVLHYHREPRTLCSLRAAGSTSSLTYKALTGGCHSAVTATGRKHSWSLCPLFVSPQVELDSHSTGQACPPPSM